MVNKRKTIRERFSNLDNNDFIKLAKKRISNSKKLITRDQNILIWKWTLNWNTIKVTNPKVYYDRMDTNNSIIDKWDSEINKIEFKDNIYKAFNKIYTSNFKETRIDETLHTTRAIITVNWWYNWLDEDLDWVEYHINFYESEQDYEDWNDNSMYWCTLICHKSEWKPIQKLLDAKYEYITNLLI